MGLGWLALGYLCAIDPFHVFFDTAAAVFFWVAGVRLGAFHRRFVWMKRAAVVLFAVGLCGAVLEIPSFFGISVFRAEAVGCAVASAGKLALLTVLWFAFGGIAKLSAGAGKTSLLAAALRCRVFSIVYYLPAALLEWADVQGSPFWVALSVFVLLLGMVVYALNLWLFYDAWRTIPPPVRFDTDPLSDKGGTQP